MTATDTRGEEVSGNLKRLPKVAQTPQDISQFEKY